MLLLIEPCPMPCGRSVEGCTYPCRHCATDTTSTEVPIVPYMGSCLVESLVFLFCDYFDVSPIVAVLAFERDVIDFNWLAIHRYRNVA